MISIQTILKYGGDLLEHCGCLDDVVYILKCIKSEHEGNKMISLDETKLINSQDSILDLNHKYMEYLD